MVDRDVTGIHGIRSICFGTVLLPNVDEPENIIRD
jgi:hypothetical protein